MNPIIVQPLNGRCSNPENGVRQRSLPAPRSEPSIGRWGSSVSEGARCLLLTFLGCDLRANALNHLISSVPRPAKYGVARSALAFRFELPACGRLACKIVAVKPACRTVARRRAPVPSPIDESTSLPQSARWQAGPRRLRRDTVGSILSVYAVIQTEPAPTSRPARTYFRERRFTGADPAESTFTVR